MNKLKFLNYAAVGDLGNSLLEKLTWKLELSNNKLQNVTMSNVKVSVYYILCTSVLNLLPAEAAGCSTASSKFCFTSYRKLGTQKLLF